MERDNLFDQEIVNVEVLKSNNSIDKDSNEKLTFNQTIAICLPAKEEKVIINYADVEKLSKQCEIIKNKKYKWSDVLLSLSSLGLGAIISAIISCIDFSNAVLAIIFYCVCPALSLASLVSYIFVRYLSANDEKSLADKIQEYIIEPVEKSKKGEEN